jgi:hypothetical protein
MTKQEIRARAEALATGTMMITLTGGDLQVFAEELAKRLSSDIDGGKLSIPEAFRIVAELFSILAETVEANEPAPDPTVN